MLQILRAFSEASLIHETAIYPLERNHSIRRFLSQIFSCLICSSIVLNTAYAQSANNPTYEWVNHKVDSTIKANDIPSLSIGIVDEGKLSYFKGFGSYERGSAQTVDETSIYQIGSDTKKLTALIVKSLVLEGKLDMDASITKYLGNDLSADAKERLREITLRNLLRHTSGIPYRAPSNNRVDGDAMLIEYTEKDLLTDLNELTLQFEPGSQFGYSNLGYAIVGYICERVSSQAYAALLEKYIVDKYGLANTMVYPDQTQLLRIPTPYRKDDRSVKTEPWKMGQMTAGGGVYSNIVDLSKLMIKQLQTYRQQIAGEIDDTFLILTEDADSSHYGLGLGKTVREGRTWYGHGGDLDGFASAYVFSPDYNKGLILLTTSGGRWVGQLERDIIDKLFR